MDQDILRTILCSSGKFTESLGDVNNLEKLIEKVPAIDSGTTSALSASLTDLITLKISPEAHQKYTARIQIIEILREWVRPPMSLAAYPAFCQSDRVLELCNNVIKKYSRDSHRLLNDDTSPSHLITLVRGLINLSTSNSLYASYLKNIINQAIELEVVHDSFEFVAIILDHEDKLRLEFSIVEKLYLIQSGKLIEEPLVDCFTESLKKYDSLKHDKNLNNFDNLQAINNFFCRTPALDNLIIKTSQSPEIFQAVCGTLKALFIHCKYSFLVLSYSQFILNTILCNQSSDKKYLIDLYPKNLQSCVVLLKVDPNHHTRNTMNYILQCLEEMYMADRDKVLILLMHFPKWLKKLSVHIDYRMDISY